MTTFFGGAQEGFGWRECEKKGLGERGWEKAWRERKRQIRKHKKCSVVLTDHGAYNLKPIANIAA